MANVVNLDTQAMIIDNAIEREADKFVDGSDKTLPARNAPIVEHFVRKLEDRYDVNRAKIDTDNAIDLLYIAYNTTPQKYGAIRNDIDDIMTKLISAQQKSQRIMAEAGTNAKTILNEFPLYYPDWEAVRASAPVAQAEDVKRYLVDDLQDFIGMLMERANAIKNSLTRIAEEYEAIIKDTHQAAKASQTALGAELAEKARIEKEINAAEAERDKLDSLVSDLEEQVQKYDKMAADFASRADTAEERAFVMSIVRVAGEVLSAAIPPLVMLSAGPESILASSAASALSAGSVAPEPSATESTTTDEISKREEIEEKRKALKLLTDEKRKDEERLESLEKAKEKDEAAKTDGSLDERIAKTKTEIADKEKEISTLEAGLHSLEAALKQLSHGLKELSQDQKDQAGELRKMQMQMLDKVDEYEKARRTQAAELVKVKALLTGKRSEEEKTELAVKSLNLSLAALKRCKEIITEIAAFFSSFAVFMGTIASDAKTRSDDIDRTATKPVIGANRLRSALTETDKFFFKQKAQWFAVGIVADKFNACFADGWSKLNKLSGTYIHGEELEKYLEGAAATIAQISREREKAADARIADLAAYRAKLAVQQAEETHAETA